MLRPQTLKQATTPAPLPQRCNERNGKSVVLYMQQGERITPGFTGAKRLEVNDQGELVVHMGGRRWG